MATPSSPGFSASKTRDEHDADERRPGCYEDRISALPKFKGWFNEELRLYEGFYCRPFLLRGVMCMQERFNARSSDVLLASFPKTGTTWLKALVFAIMNRSRYEKEGHPLLKKLSHDCIKSLEWDVYINGEPTDIIDNIPSPRLFHTHVPYTSLPKSIIDTDCKIIYISRDPKDVLISLYHFQSKVIPQMRAHTYDDNATIEDNTTLTYAHDLFCNGVSIYGPYWDHVLSYWKAHIELQWKILFLKYEDVKKDPQFYVRKLAQFLGQPFSLQEEDEGEVQHIVNLCSFEFLSHLPVNKTGVFKFNIINDAFYRKGDIGDWKNHLTVDMAERVDQTTKQKFYGYNLTL